MNQPKQSSISVPLAVFPILKSYTRDTPTHINAPHSSKIKRML